MDTTGEVSQAALEEIVRRIVRIADPDRIILFGSAARGALGPHSDLDLLVIKSGPIHRRNLAGEIYMQIGDVEYPLDIVVVTPEDVEKYKDVHCLIIKPALREGKVIYERRAA